ncbi:MAG: anaerobic carbon-monoxide dehydrogenase catalytic subunit [Nitrospirae bacterium]|nr:MAG: anaerobic carbon-monoxide dehydrogenase catalytic subunit [Nitrospirota bacterium]
MEKKKIRTAQPGTEQIIDNLPDMETCFDRADKMKPCPIGHEGACCKNCHMGPCRLVGKDAENTMKGVCGATLPVVTARYFARMVAAGTACHGDHGRDMAFTLLAVAEGHAKDFQVKDVKKLYRTADILGIEFEGRPVLDVAKDVATKILEDFGRQRGEMNFIKRAPKKTQDRWKKYGIVPRGMDREVVEVMDRTTMGMDADPDSILDAALRCALANGWGGSMISTDVTDILFGTPMPVRAEASLGIFREDEVNIIVHGHEPSLAEMIVEAVSEPELIEYAKSKGAKGINLGGMCCTANEVLMRHGIATAGGFTNQEPAIMTGLIDAFTVDVQCIIPAIVDVAKKFHTKVITSSDKVKIPGAVHMPFDEHIAKDQARQIVRIAIDNYPNRTKKGSFVTEKSTLIGGFSHEYIEYMQGGKYRGSFRPLNDAIMAGRVRGVVGMAGCDNPRWPSTGVHKYLATELIKNDVLIVSTGCSSAACGGAGYLTPEMALENAGPGLREVCEAIGIPPILHLGACVDNTRILTIASAMAAEGGLSDEIGGMPAVGIAPEWITEKAVSIGAYFAASGVPVIFGGESPVKASKEVTRILTEVWFERYRGAFIFEPDPEKMLAIALDYIDKARAALKLKKYEPGKFTTEKVLMDMTARREMKAAKPHIGL